MKPQTDLAASPPSLVSALRSAARVFLNQYTMLWGSSLGRPARQPALFSSRVYCSTCNTTHSCSGLRNKICSTMIKNIFYVTCVLLGWLLRLNHFCSSGISWSGSKQMRSLGWPSWPSSRTRRRYSSRPPPRGTLVLYRYVKNLRDFCH